MKAKLKKSKPTMTFLADNNIQKLLQGCQQTASLTAWNRVKVQPNSTGDTF
jgi:hypothetical protein